MQSRHPAISTKRTGSWLTKAFNTETATTHKLLISGALNFQISFISCFSLGGRGRAVLRPSNWGINILEQCDRTSQAHPSTQCWASRTPGYYAFPDSDNMTVPIPTKRSRDIRRYKFSLKGDRGNASPGLECGHVHEWASADDQLKHLRLKFTIWYRLKRDHMHIYNNLRAYI